MSFQTTEVDTAEYIPTNHVVELPPLIAAPVLSTLSTIPNSNTQENSYSYSIEKFLQENPVARLLRDTDDFSVLFAQGWRRYSVFPQVLIPVNYFVKQLANNRTEYFLIIHCQITGERLNSTTKRHKVMRADGKEQLIVGNKGLEFLQSQFLKGKLKWIKKQSQPKEEVGVFDSAKFFKTYSKNRKKTKKATTS